ncbi:protein kinase [Nocardia sp. NPDC059239]|uniref:protein kinase domain-containing protein n=1 Tax=unclassified Nocardia TaxID=2637762 RepID=UPI00368B0EF2
MAASDPRATQRNRPPDIRRDLEGTGLDDPQVIGRGGFGVVYRCWQRALNRHVAVKVLTTTKEVEPENFERFLREQQAMGTLSGHPHIVQVLQVGITRSGLPYLVMPYHSRGSLEDRIRRDGPLPADESVGIAIKLAGALETAHRAGILHRDVKPGNVLLTDYGEPQLTDFGIARVAGGFETSADVLTGSPAFTAPEILRSRGPSVASDVYGLGATLFCMITGHAAFERRSGEQLVAQFVRIAAEPIPNLRPDGFPDDLCAAIEASMAPDPAGRPHTAMAFGELLQEIQRARGMPVQDMTWAEATDDLPSPPPESTNPLVAIHPQLSLSRRYPTTPPAPGTKYRPAVSTRSLVRRDRLMDVLRRGSRPRLTVIHAPAGFGKSTLAAQWARYLATEENVTVTWLNADRDDNNVVWFLTHLIEAIHRADPTLVPSLDRMLEEQGESAIQHVLTTLINNVHEHRVRVAVVIDDWHRVTDTAAIGALRFLLENGCHHLQIIVTSRSSGGLPLATMRVHNELVEIDSAALRFDVSETKTFLVETSGIQLTGDEVAELRSCTEGWVAALQLASLTLRENPTPADLISHLTGRHHTIAEYLAENVLDAVEPDLLDILMETSLPERISGALANALTGTQRGQALLEEIERRDLFLRRIDDDGLWFRYHHLFAQFLRQRLDRDRPERVPALHRAAAAWFDAHGMLSEAIDHSLAVGDEDRAVDLVEAHAMDLVQHAQLATLVGLVAKLPPARMVDRPRIHIAVAWAYMLLRQLGDMNTTLRVVRKSLEDSGQGITSDLAVEAALIAASAQALGDRLDGVDAAVTECLSRTDTLSPWVLSVAASTAAFLAVYRFEFDRARAWHDWAAPYYQQVSGTFGSMYSHCLAGLAAREQLDIRTAEQSFRKARHLAAVSAGEHSYAARLAGALLGELLYERDQLDAAEQLLDEVYELGIEGGVVEFLMAAFATGARIKALHGDLEAAARRLDEGARTARELSLPRLSARITTERIRLGFAAPGIDENINGDNGIAKLTAELNEDSAIRLLLRDHMPDRVDIACVRAEQLRSSVDAEQRPRAALYARLLLTSCLATAGRIDEAKDALVPALATCADLGLIRPLRDESPAVISLIRTLEHDLRAGLWHDNWPTVSGAFLLAVLDD